VAGFAHTGMQYLSQDGLARGALMRRICNLASLILLAGALCALVVGPALAQSIPVLRGQVVLADSATRAAGIIVAASDTSGVVVSRALSGTPAEPTRHFRTGAMD
jgi:hypothetical protein